MTANSLASNSLFLILRNKKYLAPGYVFFIMNVLIGTWAIYIPAIKEKLAIDEGAIGFAIFFMAIGTLTMLFTAPIIINKVGVGNATGYGGILMLLSILVPFVATNYYVLCLGLYLVGLTSGFTDISMNTLVTELEKKDKVHIMAANHGLFSLGGMVGAGVGTFFLPYTETPVYHALVVVSIFMPLQWLLMKNYRHIVSEEVEKMSFGIQQFKPLLMLGIIGFFVMASEGAIVDWSALYLEEVSNAPEMLLGLGYTSFSLTMALGRFAGDGISMRFGSKNIMKVGSFLGALGFAMVLMENTTIAIMGFGMVGLGLSAIVPELFRVGGKTSGIESTKGVSFIAGSGYIGFLLGPVFLGFLARISNLKLSFIALLCFTLIAFLIAFRVGKKKN
jgi:fucose permease